MDDERERSISQRIERIKEAYGCTYGSLHMRNSKTKSSSNTVTKKRTRSTYKLHIGWKHAEGMTQKPKQVKKFENGGGVRTIEYDSEVPLNVQSLIQLGISLFFPNGVSSVGIVSDMVCTLGNFEGQEIGVFLDREGNVCSFQQYLKSFGIYSSKCHLYLITQKITKDAVTSVSNIGTDRALVSLASVSDSGAGKIEIPVNTTNVETSTASSVRDETIYIKFSKENNDDSFNEIQTRINCYSMTHCQEMCRDPDILEDENFSPFSNGFYVSAIKKNNKTYLEKNFTDNIVHFPQWHSIPEGQVILHGPNEINGYESDGSSFVIGIVSIFHNGSGHPYVWIKDGETIDTGLDHCLLNVTDEGLYSGGVLINQTLITSVPVKIIQKDGTLSVSVPEAIYTSGTPVTTTSSTEATNTPKNRVMCEDESQKMVEDHNYVPECNFKDLSFGEQIGKGAFGTVFKGEWLGAKVAIKTVRVRRMKMVKTVIDRELIVHSRVRHPNIVQLMAYCTEVDNLHLVSDFVNGPNLEEVIFGSQYEEFLKAIDKKDVSLQVVSAVAYLHNMEPPIIHRDIKPENIILDKKSFTAKLCDLGVSKIENINSIVTTVGEGAEQPGTPAYQAPEILLEKRVGDKNSDVWSLACSLFEFFAEVQIWGFSDVETIRLEMQKNSAPSGFKTAKLVLAEPLHVFIGTAFQYNPKDRPSAIEFLNVLKHM